MKDVGTPTTDEQGRSKTESVFQSCQEDCEQEANMTTSSLGIPFLQDVPYPGPAAFASGILSGAESSGYVLVPLRAGADFTLYRGRQHGNPSPVLVVALTGEQPSPQSLKRLEHEYSLAAELDPGWAARPLALSRHAGRTILVLKDPGGEPLDRILAQRPGS